MSTIVDLKVRKRVFSPVVRAAVCGCTTLEPEDYDMKKVDGKDFVVNLPRNAVPGPLAAQGFPLEDWQTFWDAYVGAATTGITCCCAACSYSIAFFCGLPFIICYDCFCRQPKSREAVESLVYETNQQPAFRQRGLHCVLGDGRFPGPGIRLEYRPDMGLPLESGRTSGGHSFRGPPLRGHPPSEAQKPDSSQPNYPAPQNSPRTSSRQISEDTGSYYEDDQF